MHMTYRGDGFGFVGAGTATNGEPVSYFRFDYNSDNIFTSDTVQVGDLECTDCVDAGDIGANAVGSSEVNSAQVQLRVTGSCPAGEAIQSISDTGAVTCVAVGGSSCVDQVYEIPLADYGNSGSDCSTSGIHKYNGCTTGLHPFFTWVDSQPGCRPVSVTVEYEKGVSCGSGVNNVLLNGAIAGSWTQVNACICDPLPIADSTLITSTTSYVDGGANTATFEGASCNGFSQITGTFGTYAIVRVEY